MTPEAISARLAGPGALVQPLAGDASTRRYFRLRWPDRSAVLCLYPEPYDPATLPFLEVHGLLVGWGIPVPRVLAVEGGTGAVLLEDLGDATLQTVLPGLDPGGRAALYREAVEQVIALQHAAAAGGGPACFHIAFDREKLAWELHFFAKHFLEGWRGREPTVDDRVALADAFDALAREIAGWPRVLTHRDYHSRNLMVHGSRLHWIDFQDARMGPATYDIVSLLRDAYVDVDEDLVQELLGEFRARAVADDPGEFARRVDLMTAQRTLKALGTFGFQGAVRGNPVYEPFIPRTLRNARRALGRRPELDGLRRVLARHLEEMQ